MLGLLPPPSSLNVWTTWALEPATLVAVAAGGVFYAAGVRRLARRARPVRWPPGRSVAFAAGSVVLLVATQSGIGVYDTTSFADHIGQHVLIGMVAPLLFALSAPLTLALQAASPRRQRALLVLIHHPITSALTYPVLAWVLFGGTLWALYFSPLFELSLRNGLVHALVHVHFFVVGYLFCWTAIRVDPSRRRVPWPALLLFVLINVPFHALLGLVIRSGASSSNPLGGDVYVDAARRWHTSVAAGQRAGAAALWAVGELFGLVLGGIVAARWIRADLRRQAREDRRLDAAAQASHPA